MNVPIKPVDMDQLPERIEERLKEAAKKKKEALAQLTMWDKLKIAGRLYLWYAITIFITWFIFMNILCFWGCCMGGLTNHW